MSISVRNGMAQPVLGFPTKSAAIIALHLEGKDNIEIAKAVGTTTAAVKVVVNTARREGKLRPPPTAPEPGRREKAARLIVATFGLIADALKMPDNELAAIALETLLFPLAEERPPESPPPAPPVPAPAGGTPLAPDQGSIDADNERQEQIEPPRTEGSPLLFHLTDGEGLYLTKDGLGLTGDQAKAWRGTSVQKEAVYKSKRHWQRLEAVPALSAEAAP